MKEEVRKTVDNSTSKDSERLYQVGDLASICGKSVRAIRLYEEKGLLKPAKRSQGGYRLYDENSLVRLNWILQMQRLGFSLTEIASISYNLDHADTAPEAMAQMRDLFTNKLLDISKKVKDLEELSEELENALGFLTTCNSCDSTTSLIECCPTRLVDRIKINDELPNILAGLYAPYLQDEKNSTAIESGVKK